ncbi:hypothetical protein GQ43DRAFT_444426 [Delitschia confertaspora ATCC 74209]|uniref:Zn(2)-C6 fungal-type domain-containing protein n=1 Tax=Delitschia confertaspora ATCC 74209 TaxID=1513339 RepID=A0A9P4JDH1_9PLEO|nr:hypothetical protein GQ43DRAFT_444426 [Delitschia confertaspora ATCC 74209]
MTGTGFPARLRQSHQSRRLNPYYRRNGKLQSCEPCRKGKLRCDHMMPTCGRCARRNRPEQCVYHPAPLTRKSTSIPTPESSETTETPPPASVYPIAQPFDSTSLLSLQFSQYNDPPTVQPRVPRASSLPAQLDPSTIHQHSLEEFRRHNLTRDDQFQKSAAFVSHSAILFEHEDTIGVDLTPSSAECQDDHEHGPSKSQIQRGASILALLKDLPTFDRYIDKWYTYTRGSIVIEPMMKAWSAGVWSTYRQVLERQKPEELIQFSTKVWTNTLKPIGMTQNTTPRQFQAMTTGENLRWEIVGLIFALVGIMGHSLQDGDPIFCSHDDAPVDRIKLIIKMSNMTESCVQFCNEFEIMNDPYLWLLYVNTIICCSLNAKGSYSNWQKSSYILQAVTAFGLHQEIKVDAHTPFFMTEFRKRLFTACYENDKFNASFVGRPPRLTRHYSLLQLPLDLNDSQLMSDGLDLQTALNSLDKNGWNQRGAIQCCTLSRIFACNAVIMEEILEISLGVLSKDEIISRAADIEARATQLYENLPSFLRLYEKDPWDGRRAPVEQLFLSYVRLCYLGHHFLLQRTLIKKAHTDSGKLLSISREIFKFILVIIQNQTRMRDFQIDFVQLLCMYGIPSAAVIAVELLKQEKDGRCEFDEREDERGVLPRSDTIQELAVFNACLGTIRPDSGGFGNCDRGRKFVKRILDTILNPPPRTQPRENLTANSSATNTFVNGIGDITGMSAVSVGDGLETPLFQMADDGEFMRWLEAREWEDGGWMSFN